MDTTPVAPTDAAYPPESALAMDRAYTDWRDRDPRRTGVMAKQGFYAGWVQALNYLKD